LGDVWRYYARVASVEVADRLLREIDAAAQRLSEDAVRWRARDELMAGLRSALVPPYVIFYRTDDGIVRSFAYCTDAEFLTPYFPKRNADGAGAAETPDVATLFRATRASSKPWWVSLPLNPPCDRSAESGAIEGPAKPM